MDVRFFSSQKTSALYSSKALDSSSYTFQCQSHGIISSKWKTAKTISSIGRGKIEKKKTPVNLQGVLSKPSKLAAFWRFVKSQYVSEFRREKRNAPHPTTSPPDALGFKKLERMILCGSASNNSRFTWKKKAERFPRTRQTTSASCEGCKG